MKITVLIENTTLGNCSCEHGLSLLCEYRGGKYLLDTGATELFADNASALGVALSDVDCAVLSHSHYDHSGGFVRFFSENASAPLYMRREAAGKCFADDGTGLRYIGIPDDMLPCGRDRIRLTASAEKLSDGVWLLPHVSEGYTQRGKAAGMLRQDGGEPVTDDFLHEQTLVFEDDGGLVICSSCSHAGSDNVVKEVMSAFPGKPVKAFIGGFHLMGHGGPETMAFPREEIERLGRFLSENISEAIYTGHCTGTPAYSVLSEVIGDKLHRLSSGLIIDL